MARDVVRIAIIGGGFSGAVVALTLLREAEIALAVEVFEPRPVLGAGVAYSSPDPAHRINVPAAKMSAISWEPAHFERWLSESGAAADDPVAARPLGRFVRRAVFGRYVDETLRAARNAHVSFRHRRARVIWVAPEVSGYRLGLDSGQTAAADHIVLAASHPPPHPPAILTDALGGDPRLIADPWIPGGLDAIRPDDRIVIVGTGLTMADVVASLDRMGHRGPITAFSRRGLLPRGHSPAAHDPYGEFASAPAPDVPGMLRQVRRSVAKARADGVPWQAVIDAVRRDATPMWRALDGGAQSRLLRHLRPFWDVHRFRIAPQVEALLVRRVAEGLLTVLAASPRRVVATEKAIELDLRLRRSPLESVLTIAADRVIVTTGPGHDALIAGNPALASLDAAGLVRPDPHGLGLDSDLTGHAIGYGGRPVANLWIAGPLARAAYGELMGLPQITLHAEATARALLSVAGAHATAHR